MTIEINSGILCAVATDDGISLIKRHFGDAVRYDLYFLTVEEMLYKETIKNPFREDTENDKEDIHGDKIKAGNMKELLLEKNVSVLVSKHFGPNIKRMVKNFVTVVICKDDVENAIRLLVHNFSSIEKMIHAGSERKPVILQ